MEDIEVGEYIRTKAGHFHKITEIGENGLIYFEDSSAGWSREQFDNIVKKHSKNIINLIEVGDLIKIKKDEGTFMAYSINKELNSVCIDVGCFGLLVVHADDIENILTHEQYELHCYRLEKKI